MTPNAAEQGVMYRRLRMMRRLLGELDKLGDVTEHQLSHELSISLLVERILTLLVDLAVAINTHVVAATGKTPETYRASFVDAAHEGLLTEELAKELQPSAGMRNVLVHEYLEIDYAKVLLAISAARTGYRSYVTQVARYLSTTNAKGELGE